MQAPRLSDRAFCSVIVPVYKQWDVVRGLLDCLEQQRCSGVKFEVLLVNNGQRADVPGDMSSSLDLTVLHCARPGAYAARNVGVAAAQGELLVFTDADCRPENDWLSRGVEALEVRDEVGKRPGLVSGRVRIVAGDPDHPNVFERYDMYTGIPQAYFAGRGYGATANLFVRREVFRGVPGFDPARFSGGDAAFCRQAASSGWRLRYCDKAIVRHPARASWEELAGKARRLKGGQLLHGTVARRAGWVALTLVPPIRFVYRTLLSRQAGVTLRARCALCGIRLRLFWVGVSELMRLGCGGSARRE